MIAIVEAYKSGLLAKKHWAQNLVAGIVVGVVALPLAMAFAIASGVKPEQGIYTAIVAGILAALLGGSRLQITGPTGAFIVILAGITAKYGVDGLQIATIMAGLILLLFGLAKMGAVIKFIPAPVIVGFTAGIGVIIWVGQWKDFFGLPKVTGEHFHQKLWHTLQVLPQLHLATTGLAILSLILLLLAPKIKALHRVPGPLIAMVVATALQGIFQFQGVMTIGTAFGGIPQTLPHFALPTITLPRIIELIGPAFTIAMLGAIESLLSAVVADGMAGTRHNSNQELVGQGIANIVSPLFGGFAATGAIARTATNVRNGGSSPIAGVTHGIVLIVIILFLAPLASDIPLAALAAILFVVAWNMSELPHLVHMAQRAPRSDVAILLITFLLTVFADLVIAVNIGVILAALLFMRRMAESVEIQAHNSDSLAIELQGLGIKKLPADVMVYSIEGPFFFGAVDNLERTLMSTNTEASTLIVRLAHVPFVDITGLQALDEALDVFRKRHIKVMVCETNERVFRKLAKAGLVEKVGEDNFFRTFADAIKQVDNH
ncbi:MAG: SulP family inorganic anion transporter [Agitococcus sp.]|nr:SulP family inorganic anion transporter [Agitococcus sp.]